jgi:chitin deacetylase
LTQTFDDGPTVYTNTLIKHLKRPATFFTLGLNIVKHPDVYRDTVAKGHVMGSHTWSHKYLPSLTNEEIVAQLEWSIWAMNATSNHLPKWFRPPYGGLDNRVRAIVRQFGMQSVLWDFDTFDWKLLLDENSKETHEQQIYRDLSKYKIDKANTGIILEHDHSAKTVAVAIKIDQEILNHSQMTVAQCAKGVDYIRNFT